MYMISMAKMDRLETFCYLLPGNGLSTRCRWAGPLGGTQNANARMGTVYAVCELNTKYLGLHMSSSSWP
uniref:Uncharacterized protein n=1 Tax=Anguilla anguilla TaxID=7936 RepID=A0A0E9QAT6_ANGAN